MRGTSGEGTRAGRYLSALSALCILGWAVPALLMVNRGFAIQDEGTYVLSYRFWHSNPYFVTGSQYFYGPVFEAFGESIPALRVLRLVMLVLVNLLFARCFLGWLEQAASGRLASSRTSLTLLIVASGGMSYLWTPLTPGYYDLTADVSLMLVALVLVTLTRAPAAGTWVPFTTGVLVVALVVVKWTAFPVAVLSVGTAAYSLSRGSHRAARRWAGLVIAGAVAALLACQVLLVPIGRFATVMRQVSSLTAVASHSMSYLAVKNVVDTLQALVGAVIIGLPLLMALLVTRKQRGKSGEGRARAWLIGAAVLTALVLPFVLGWRGGSDRGRVVVSVALAGLLVALLSAVLPDPLSPLPEDVTGRLVAATLFLVPLAQAAGTNVPLVYVAFECMAMWVSLVLLIMSSGRHSSLSTTAVLVNLSVVGIATAMICGTTTLATPFKTSGFSSATADVPQLGLDVSPGTAARYAALTRALAPYVIRGRTPVFAMDQNAGLAYLSGGVPAGSTWNDESSPTRTAGILALACRNGDVTSAPVLLLSRPVDGDVARALDECGFHYPGGYRPLRVPGGPTGLTVLVPQHQS